MASASLVLPSLTPKTLAFSNTQNPSVTIFSVVSLTSSVKRSNGPTTSISFSPPSNKTKRYESLLSSSLFVPKVSFSSGFKLDEELSGEEDEQSFSPDLKLFVGNLPFSVDSAELARLFERAGNVEMVEVIYDKMTGRSRGFGFVTMSTVEEVEAAAQQLNGLELDGRSLRVNAGPPPPKEGSSRGPRGGASFNSANRVYVGNLSWGVDDLALESLFGEQGKVMEARVVYDRETGRSRGFGFVTYSSAREVNNAVSTLNGVDLNGRSIRVTLAESKPRREF